MDWTSSDVLEIIYHLLPGFLAAWIFHGLTAHPKRTPFERIVQALIFTAFVKPLVAAIGLFFCWIGEHLKIPFGQWNENTSFAWALVIAIALGLVFSYCANRDFPHRLFRNWCITKKTAYPSVWYRAFDVEKRFVVLHLLGPNKRRLFGYPHEWPDDPEHGHFVITCPQWLLNDGKCVPVHRVKKMLIRAKRVNMVDFVYDAKEVKADAEAVKQAEESLIKNRLKEEEEDGQPRQGLRPKKR